jgi:glycosyltransferase 2 family protein
MKRLSLLLALVGLLVVTAIIGAYGFETIADSLVSIGVSGLMLLLAWQLGLFGVLGTAWFLLVPRSEQLPASVFIWGRMVRDSAAVCLPFSAAGGFAFGARAVVLLGVRWSLATASTIADVTVEFVAQIAFAAIGLVLLMVRWPSAQLAVPLAAGIALAVAAACGFLWAQRSATGMIRSLARRLAGRFFASAGASVEVLQAELDQIYIYHWDLALAGTVHLAGWIATGAASWIAFLLLGVDIDLPGALVIEALLDATVAVAFLVPGGLGVQEIGYAGFGALFGVPVEVSLSVSLLRRAKDLVLGIPILLIWQLSEVRRLRSAPHP